jgi:hypothetical protein
MRARRTLPTMPHPNDLTGPAALALRYLVDLAAGVGGYLCRGVRGWARLEAIERTVRIPLAGRLPHLVQRGFLDLHDARAPHQRGAVRMYRATDRASPVIANHFGQRYHWLSPPRELALEEKDAAFYIPSGALAALEQLRHAIEDPRPTHFAQHGWRTLRELQAQSEPPAPPRPRNWRGERGDDRGEGWKPEGWVPGFDEDEVLPRLPDQYPPMLRGLLNDPADWRDSLDDHAPPPWAPARWRHEAGIPIHFTGEDLEWLAQQGLALKSTTPGRGRRVPVWRVTAAGAVAIALDWIDPWRVD